MLEATERRSTAAYHDLGDGMKRREEVLPPPLATDAGSARSDAASARGRSTAPGHQASTRFRPDGSVLLSIPHNKLYRLNAVGTLAWDVLAEKKQGITALDLAREMGVIFDQVNAEGEFHLQAPPERLQADMERLLENSAAQGLLRVDASAGGSRAFTIADGICRSQPPRPTPSEDETAGSGSSAEGTREAPSAAETFSAFLALALCDLVLKFAGFARMVRYLRNRTPGSPRAAGQSTVRRICAAVDRAQVLYPKKAMCLQRSAVVTWLLRRRGVAAEMVVAARDFPLAAHAWVEVEGRVVNDGSEVQSRYAVITRL